MNWREKYRPNRIEELAGCERLKKASRQWIEKGECPSNLLFVGPPGTGKSSAALSLAKEMLGEFFDSANYIVTNASDDRGIDYVRELKFTVKQKGLGVKRRFFLLDEADNLTPAAQKALRQIMEDSYKTAVFILTANDIGPIHSAIRDRCMTFEFNPISDNDAEQMLLKIHQMESLPEQWKEQYRGLNRLTNGSLRKSIDILQGVEKEPDALLAWLKKDTQNINQAALNFVQNEFSKVAAFLKSDLNNGKSKVGTLKNLRGRVRSLLESEEEWYAFMLTYGEFILLAHNWPDDDDAYVDYFVAKLMKNRR